MPGGTKECLATQKLLGVLATRAAGKSFKEIE
jgi:hypothetical protein